MNRRSSEPRPEGRLRLVLLDRDGTLIEHVPYLRDPDGVRLLPGVGPALRRLADLGIGLRVVTNQSGVGRGLMTEADVAAVNRRTELALSSGFGVRIDGFHVCPHRPEDRCGCRKPAPGLIIAALDAHGVAPTDAVLVGDAPSDVEAGRAAGVRSVQVSTGPWDLTPRGGPSTGRCDLATAVDRLLAI